MTTRENTIRTSKIDANRWDVIEDGKAIGSIEHISRACWAGFNLAGERVGAVMPRSRQAAIRNVRMAHLDAQRRQSDQLMRSKIDKVGA